MNQHDNHSPDALPEPDSSAKHRSEQLIAEISAACVKQGGSIPFSHYMNMALYQPGLGYYAGGLQKFGEQGDFITSPEVSPLFARCFARQVKQVMSAYQSSSSIDDVDVIEFGAGSGVFAADILVELEKLNSLPSHYYIIELSSELRQRQEEKINSVCPHLQQRVQWLLELPESIHCAVVIANEVLDAMPVEIMNIQNGELSMLHVKTVDHQVTAVNGAVSDRLSQKINEIEQRSDIPLSSLQSFRTEVNLYADSWVSALEQCIENMVCFVIDYGYNEQEYFHPDRHQGTMMCYYRHRAHTDPFWWPGIQDITAFVNFTDLAYAADSVGLDVSGYTTQSAFLLANGLSELHQSEVTDDVIEQARLSQQIKTLTLPSEMGERFKVLAISKNFTDSISGFSMLDLRNRL